MSRELPILDGIGPASGSAPRESRAAPGPSAEEKLTELVRQLAPRVAGGLLVAFSGGLDSAFLLWAASQALSDAGDGGRVVALTTTSPSTPGQDKDDARAFSGLLGVDHIWEESREMELPSYVQNDRGRCYHCKAELFRIAREKAEELGLGAVAYGYNASDRGDLRPGHEAALEAGILTPLADAALTKTEIQLLMRDLGLPLAGKPASPCLSSRITTGIPITPQRLSDVQALEEILRRAGVTTLRVRVCRDEAGSSFLRVEVAPEAMALALECREALYRAGRERGYRWVTLDLGGYRMGGGVS